MLIVTVAALVAGGLAAYLRHPGPSVGLSSVMELWSDILRDADQVGLKLTRVSDADEMELGRQTARALMRNFHENRTRQPRVQRAGARLTPFVRRKGIRYRFHVIESQQINAFALPGGHVFIFTGLLDILPSDDELASVLGHEISHIDLRHSIERCQYEMKFKGLGARPLGRIAGR